MNYKKSTNTADRETLSAEDEKVRRLLAGLNRVEAPKDFDFRLRARIANSSSADSKPRFLPHLRYVLPLFLVLALSGALVFNHLYFSIATNSPAIVDTDISDEKINENRAVRPPEVLETATANVSEPLKIEATALDLQTPPTVRRERAGQTVAAAKPARFIQVRSVGKSKVQPPRNPVEDSANSRLSALSTARQIITPPGIKLNQTIERQPEFGNDKPLTAKEILSQLGAETTFDSRSWKVLSIRRNSPAERSGIKIDDAIEAIDGEKLTDKLIGGKKIEGKTLTVRRGAAQIEIQLNN